MLVRIGVPAWEARRAYRIGDKVTPTSFNIAGAPYVFEAVQIGISTGWTTTGNAIFYNKTAPTEPNWASAGPRSDARHDRRRHVPLGHHGSELRSVLLRHPLEEHRVSVPVGAAPKLNP